MACLAYTFFAFLFIKTIVSGIVKYIIREVIDINVLLNKHKTIAVKKINAATKLLL